MPAYYSFIFEVIYLFIFGLQKVTFFHCAQMKRPEKVSQAHEGKWVGGRQARLLNIQRKNCRSCACRCQKRNSNYMSKGNVIVFRCACEAQHPVIAQIQPLRSLTKGEMNIAWFFFFMQLVGFILYSLENRGSLLSSIIPWRNFNIHGAFPFHRRFFRLLKCPSN